MRVVPPPFRRLFLAVAFATLACSCASGVAPQIQIKPSSRPDHWDAGAVESAPAPVPSTATAAPAPTATADGGSGD